MIDGILTVLGMFYQGYRSVNDSGSWIIDPQGVGDYLEALFVSKGIIP